MHQYWKSLDGLRAVAVFIVLLAHAGSPYPSSGCTGVDIFFVLSGFLITGILSREYAEYQRIRFKFFYVRRFLRLMPCLIVACILFACLTVYFEGVFPYKVLAILLTYTANWARAIYEADLSSMAHCWSLAIEEQFYLIWPLVILGLEKASRNDSTKGWFLVALASLLALYRASMVGTFDAVRIYCALDTHMDGLVFGSALSYFMRAGRSSESDRDRTSLVLSYLLAPAAIVGLLVLMYLIDWYSMWMGRLGYFLAAIASMAIIADLVRSKKSLIAGVLSLPTMAYLGRISYGLYLLHFPIFHAVDLQMGHNDFLVLAPIKISLSILAAAISFHFCEAPFLKLKKRFAP